MGEVVNKNESDWTDSDATQDLFANKRPRSILVPIGCFATAAILASGLWSFKKGNVKHSQYWMRARVVSQMTTVLLMAGTTYGMSFTGSSS
ncbi:HIG1 domain family member 2A, mitochondrial-like [Selaginella moellendorffii]|uniref:HIG1 domain family member 2A, mitochondrial-like n=1 Tax=Selaginella moellendorffii TaxID=88036 RepID=UPI000D1C775F|nr:HIG1 domain family member 2A, mitochondrial-like [Selaginella moellendorffii]|eukprot:XP_024524071.1 HIG1 domain family member 2A, mitochondrial-like [Selaginella moellendorffii]